jgi:hypothetical protein
MLRIRPLFHQLTIVLERQLSLLEVVCNGLLNGFRVELLFSAVPREFIEDDVPVYMIPTNSSDLDRVSIRLLNLHRIRSERVEKVADNYVIGLGIPLLDLVKLLVELLTSQNIRTRAFGLTRELIAIVLVDRDETPEPLVRFLEAWCPLAGLRIRRLAVGVFILLPKRTVGPL